jgi:hypothetical protein
MLLTSRKMNFSPLNSWFSNSRNFILKNFSVIISSTIWAFHWSCKLSSFKWHIMSQSKYRSLFHFSSRSPENFLGRFSKNWTVSSLSATKRCSIIPLLNKWTSVWYNKSLLFALTSSINSRNNLCVSLLERVKFTTENTTDITRSWFLTLPHSTYW